MVSEAREVLIITGLSGAGRTTVANALEDIGYFVVDNLPPAMLRQLVELVGASDSLPRLAIVIDVRGGVLFDDAIQLLQLLKVEYSVTLIFLEASDEAIVRRFEAVRRPHPLQGDGTIIDGIRMERNRLSELRSQADQLIDTSNFNVHQLTKRIIEHYSDSGRPKFTLTILSFGFKYGLPVDADLVIDMRFIPNPFWKQELRELTGEDERVSDYVLHQAGAAEFFERYVHALQPVLEGYRRENKRHVILAVGCTGGKHRSVASARYLGKLLADTADSVVRVTHRDLGRE
ncbi:MAG TPA: RNase adapter RapZ [Candidatus Agrococcus pullicola]|uniref:RNase adapter RapZ n=1 Tax=Candidatus Agrococcus pullicola TaxID=2838429 RepID=A0A9D1YXY0_9MICO|nr:RNase adapter RapZ [Candidatus Agrococcus pullicola]